MREKDESKKGGAILTINGPLSHFNGLICMDKGFQVIFSKMQKKTEKRKFKSKILTSVNFPLLYYHPANYREYIKFRIPKPNGC